MNIILLTLTALSISIGLLVYLIHNIFVAGSMLDRKSLFIGLSVGSAVFLGVGWIAS
jgi:hypothetical protein